MDEAAETARWNRTLLIALPILNALGGLADKNYQPLSFDDAHPYRASSDLKNETPEEARKRRRENMIARTGIAFDPSLVEN